MTAGLYGSESHIRTVRNDDGSWEASTQGRRQTIAVEATNEARAVITLGEEMLKQFEQADGEGESE